MLQFRIGKIPVTVHGSHLLIAALFAYQSVSGGIVNFVTGDVIARPGADNYARFATIAVAGWMAIISLSVLVHELGHAMASVAFGFAPAIHLAWLGGHTETHMDPRLAWYKRFAIILAGPVAGGLLGLLGLFIAVVFTMPPLVEYLLYGLALANAFWAVLNLIPVPPLDGAQMTHTVLTRMLGARGFLVANIIGALVGAAMTYFSLQRMGPIAIFIFGMGTFEAIRGVAAYLRGEGPGTGATPEQLSALQSATDALAKNDLQAAEGHAQTVLEGNPPAVLLSRGHYVLGWVALRRREGRRALDHFAQAGKTHVEPEALATAFSLVGDDLRASGLWELAYRERKTSGALHAWAASLLLLGQDDQAKTISGVDLAVAELLAARTAFNRRDFPTAAKFAVRSVERSPSDEAAYDAACAFAQAGDSPRAWELLEKARSLGYSDASHAAKDPDLAPLRGHPGFEAWLAQSGQTSSV